MCWVACDAETMRRVRGPLRGTPESGTEVPPSAPIVLRIGGARHGTGRRCLLTGRKGWPARAGGAYGREFGIGRSRLPGDGVARRRRPGPNLAGSRTPDIRAGDTDLGRDHPHPHKQAEDLTAKAE